ncbi:MAG: type II toxin-antitoxin system RelE/ParE family toxin [Leptospirales bacterium]
MGKVHWSEIAQFDLENIGDYIADDPPIFAIEFIENLLQHTRNLENYPFIGRVVPEFEIESLREIIYFNYRIVYKLKSEIIYIVSITHSSMDIKNKAKKQKWEVH